MGKRIRALIPIVFVAPLVILTACSTAPGKPTITIVSPAHGSEFREGDNVAVQSVATGAPGINRVELAVDGAIVRSDSPLSTGQTTFPVVQNWKATQGTHTIAVRAFDSTGMSSDPVAVSVSVLSSAAPTLITAPSVSASPAPTAAPLPPPTVQSAPPPTVACTDNVTLITEVSATPSAAWTANQAFNKIWRVLNAGTCAWDARYQFVSVGGESMATVTVIPVQNTAPGATAEILVSMMAPSAPGPHTGLWQMRGPNGVFGTPITATIEVAAPAAVPPPLPAGCAGIPVIDLFAASPATINPGQSTTLIWGKVDYASKAEIDQGIGGVGTPGSSVVNPAATTIYTMSASGCGGTVTKQITVTVKSQ